MQNDKIEAAINAATQLISVANEYLDETSKPYSLGEYAFRMIVAKQSGALRRASMELTRALTEMMKP
jgi:methionyl-tRNA synthetase